MTQEERREYLLKYLLKEDLRFRGRGMPTGKLEQERLLRALMNIRPPKPISEEF